MNGQSLRVAFFPDTYHEIDGVANTSRQYEAYAIRNRLPFLIIHGAAENGSDAHGSVIRAAYGRSRVGFALDKKHDFDLAFWRHYQSVEATVREFDPDILHITGPSDVGQLGALVAHRLQVPLAASWHTNLHEYAERRWAGLFRFLPTTAREKAGSAVRAATLKAVLRFYKIARILFAPNRELIQLVERGTGKACYPMHRGVDTELFTPHRRDRSDDTFILGYVGRLTVEKNIRLLAPLEKALLESGLSRFKFLIVGQGAEEGWLRENLCQADFTGVLKGADLARAFANMDLFVFPSQTDTYGNVVLEAFASGVPAVCTGSGGPRFIVRHGENGFVARDFNDFVTYIRTLATCPTQLAAMRLAARAQALSASWDNVFDSVYDSYEHGLRTATTSGRNLRVHPQSGFARTGTRT